MMQRKLVRVGAAAKMMNVDQKTITNRVDNPVLQPYFSPSARGEIDGGRQFTWDDLLVLNTIRVERAKTSAKNTNWQAIADVLASGYRNTQMLPQAKLLDTEVSTFADTEQITTIIPELVHVLDATYRAFFDRLERLENQWRADTERNQEKYLCKISELKVIIARLEATQGITPDSKSESG